MTQRQPLRFFEPLPKGELDLDWIKRWVENNISTFQRSISFSGDLLSGNWDGNTPADLSQGAQDPNATTGFYIDASAGAAQFNGDLFLHQNSELFVGGNVNVTGTMFANAFTQGVDGWRLNPFGSVEFYDPVFVGDHTAASPSVRRLGTADGLFFASGVLGVAIGGAEVDRAVADGWTNVARGTLGYAEATADQTSITSTTDLTGCNVGVDVAANRLIRITGSCEFSSDAADDVAFLGINEGSTLLQRAIVMLPVADSGQDVEKSVVITPSEGAHTYKLQVARVSGSGSLRTEQAADRPAFILVEDIGPA